MYEGISLHYSIVGEVLLYAVFYFVRCATSYRLPYTSYSNHAYIDAATYAEWGADYLKYDDCGQNNINRRQL